MREFFDTELELVVGETAPAAGFNGSADPNHFAE
jgi:hypothetical protein